MKIIIINLKEEIDPDELDEMVSDIEIDVAWSGIDYSISVQEDDSKIAAEFNQLMNDIEREEAGISWQSNP